MHVRSETSIVKGAYPKLDAAAFNVVKQSPKWIPAKLNGKPVQVCAAVPIIFVQY